jgi:hypothetical protein
MTKTEFWSWSTPLGLTWVDIGGDALSLATFIIWVWQIVRSAKKYYNYGKHSRNEILSIHLTLFAANILYLFYELNSTNKNPTEVVFTM